MIAHFFCFHFYEDSKYNDNKKMFLNVNNQYIPWESSITE